MTPDEISHNREILRHLPAWLKSKGLNQRLLAERLGVSEPTVSKWMSGRQNITMAQFMQIASLLDAQPEDLLFRRAAMAAAVAFGVLQDLRQTFRMTFLTF